jgi:hypothetical protein
MYELVIAFVGILIVLKANSVASAPHAHDSERINSTIYDIIVKGNLNETRDVQIGYVGKILLDRKTINDTDMIYKYKLLYALPSQTTLSASELNTLNKDTMFTIGSENGSIRMRLTMPFANNNNETLSTLKYLCTTKRYCPCDLCIFNLNIIYSTANRINSDVVRVFIDEVNQHKPEFYTNADMIVVNMSEASTSNDRVKLDDTAMAFDRDAHYNKLSYYLVNVNADGSASRTSDGNYVRTGDFRMYNEQHGVYIVSNTTLDYERQKIYDFYLVVEDNGMNTLRNMRRLTVYVTDENDNRPVCDKTVFYAEAGEYLLIKNLLHITADDRDSGLNGLVEYTLRRDNNEAIGSTSSDTDDYFHVDKSTGWLSIVKPLTWHRQRVYTFTVGASDRGLRHSYTTYCQVQIRVLSTDDSIRVIDHLDESTAYGFYSTHDGSTHANQSHATDASIYENNNFNKRLATIVNAYDARDGSGGRNAPQHLIHVLLNDSAFDVTTTDMDVNNGNTTAFNLLAIKSFDYETKAVYYLNVTMQITRMEQTIVVDDRVYTNMRRTFQTNKMFVVHVLDLNDNKPKFTRTLYEFHVNENDLNRNFVSIEAHDADGTSKNSQLSYRIVEPYAQERFTLIGLDEQTFVTPTLYLRTPFDHEKDGDRFEFHVEAMDAGGLYDNANVVFHIRNINDNRPLFSANQRLSISETAPPHTFIAYIRAVDADNGSNGRFTYSLVGVDANAVFEINRTSGILSNRVLLDRTYADLYEIEVEVCDEVVNGIGPKLTNRHKYVVDVQRVDSYGPYFVLPKSNTHVLPVKLPRELAMGGWSLYDVVDSEKIVSLFDVHVFLNKASNTTDVAFKLTDSLDVLRINSRNGSVYTTAALLLSRLANKNKKTRQDWTSVRQIVDVCLTATSEKYHENSLNFSLYLNYNVDELPEEARTVWQMDLDAYGEVDDGTTTGFLKSDRMATTSGKLVQLLSNSALITVLTLSLVFAIFILCLIVTIVYKSKFCKPNRDPPMKSKADSCLAKMKACLRDRIRQSDGQRTFKTTATIDVTVC